MGQVRWALLLTALYTGMRRGELLQLRWRSVDLGSGRVEIESSKSGKRRTVPLRPEVVQALRSLPKFPSCDHVFANDGAPLRSINTAFRGAVKRAGIDGRVRFHDLRHTAASWMAQNGADLLQIKDVLGHATITTTQRYAHLVQRNSEQAVARMPTLGGEETATRTATESQETSPPGSRRGRVSEAGEACKCPPAKKRRRGWDSNPRPGVITREPDFESGAVRPGFATPPYSESQI